MKLINYLCLLFLLNGIQQANAVVITGDKLVIRAGVAKEFQNGLHTKYLVYFADKLFAELEISPMTFARRLHQLKAGKLDSMVGLQRTENREDEFIYIYPAYENLKHHFYSLKENSDNFTKYSDFHSKTVGTHRHAKYFSTFDLDKNVKKHPLSTLKQNIELLLHKRIDAFIHYEESTYPVLTKLGLNDKIVKTHYQPPQDNLHFLAISSHSPLVHFKIRLENIVIKALENGDLRNIRKKHYRQKNH
jgi:polar amino acid transport system substrate-binding protein